MGNSSSSTNDRNPRMGETGGPEDLDWGKQSLPANAASERYYYDDHADEVRSSIGPVPTLDMEKARSRNPKTEGGDGNGNDAPLPSSSWCVPARKREGADEEANDDDDEDGDLSSEEDGDHTSRSWLSFGTIKTARTEKSSKKANHNNNSSKKGKKQQKEATSKQQPIQRGNQHAHLVLAGAEWQQLPISPLVLTDGQGRFFDSRTFAAIGDAASLVNWHRSHALTAESAQLRAAAAAMAASAEQSVPGSLSSTRLPNAVIGEIYRQQSELKARLEQQWQRGSQRRLPIGTAASSTIGWGSGAGSISSATLSLHSSSSLTAGSGGGGATLSMTSLQGATLPLSLAASGGSVHNLGQLGHFPGYQPPAPTAADLQQQEDGRNGSGYGDGDGETTLPHDTTFEQRRDHDDDDGNREGDGHETGDEAHSIDGEGDEEEGSESSSSAHGGEGDGTRRSPHRQQQQQQQQQVQHNNNKLYPYAGGNNTYAGLPIAGMPFAVSSSSSFPTSVLCPQNQQPQQLHVNSQMLPTWRVQRALDFRSPLAASSGYVGGSGRSPTSAYSGRGGSGSPSGPSALALAAASSAHASITAAVDAAAQSGLGVSRNKTVRASHDAMAQQKQAQEEKQQQQSVVAASAAEETRDNAVSLEGADQPSGSSSRREEGSPASPPAPSPSSNSTLARSRSASRSSSVRSLPVQPLADEKVEALVSKAAQLAASALSRPALEPTARLGSLPVLQ